MTGGLLRRIVFVEFRFFFGGKRMRQEDAVAPPDFGVTAMGTDHIVQRIRIGLFSGKFIHLKRTATSGIGASLELHGEGGKIKKQWEEIFAAFILLQFPRLNPRVIEERERCLIRNKPLSIHA
jgi:hypothetical protein